MFNGDPPVEMKPQIQFELSNTINIWYPSILRRIYTYKYSPQFAIFNILKFSKFSRIIVPTAVGIYSGTYRLLIYMIINNYATFGSELPVFLSTDKCRAWVSPVPDTVPFAVAKRVTTKTAIESKIRTSNRDGLDWIPLLINLDYSDLFLLSFYNL